MMDWYKHYSVELGETVFDLGAGGEFKHEGESTYFYSTEVGETGLVVAVEPVIKNYGHLLRMVVEKRLLNVIPVFLAIGEETSRQLINISQRSPGHSLTLYYSKLHVEERVVPTVSWDDLVDMLCIEHVDLAKVNIEGAEEMLLRGMTKVLPDRMGLKLHIKRGGVTIENMRKLLEEKGYRVKRVRQGRDTSFLAELRK